MEEIRIGTIGSGVIVHSILDNVMRTEGIELEAVYSRSEEKAKKLAGEYGCTKTYTDLEEFLSDKDINTVYIAIPNLLHYEHTKKALLAGKHVITEKPFTTKRSQARELMQIAKERNLFLIEAAPTSFLPNFSILKRELSKIGRIKLVISNYSQYSSRYDAVLRGEKPAIFDPQYAGGCLMDINFYNVLLNILLFGKPKTIKYYANRFPGLSDTSGTVLMEYEGFVSSNAGAKDTWGVNFFQIEGEKGYIYIENGSNGIKSVRTVTKTSDDTYNEQAEPDRWFYEVKEITRLMRNNNYKEIYSRLNSTIDTVDVLESARKAAGIFFPGDYRERTVLGIDIGGTYFRMGLVKENGVVVGIRKIHTSDVLKSDDVISDIARYIQSNMPADNYDAVSIGFPATLDRERKRVLQAPNLNYMDNLPVTESLTDKLGVPVLIERDVTLALHFDMEKYKLPKEGVVCGIYFGTGIGNAIIIDGKPYKGKNGVAGELGHIPINNCEILCGCGNVGCSENIAGGKYLVHLQREYFPDTPVAELFSRHSSEECMINFVNQMASVITTEINILDPDYVLVGGGVVNMKDFPLEYLNKCILNKVRKPYPKETLRLIFTNDEPEKSILGAAIYANNILNEVLSVSD